MSKKNKQVDNTTVGFRGQVIQKPKNMGATIKRLAGYLKKSSFMIVAALLVNIAGTLMQDSPKRLGNAITLIFEGFRHGTGVDFEQVGFILLTVAVLYVGVFIATFLQQRLMVLVAQKSTYRLRNELKAKMNRVPVSYFDKNANGN